MTQAKSPCRRRAVNVKVTKAPAKITYLGCNENEEPKLYEFTVRGLGKVEAPKSKPRKGKKKCQPKRICEQE